MIRGLAGRRPDRRQVEIACAKVARFTSHPLAEGGRGHDDLSEAHQTNRKGHHDDSSRCAIRFDHARRCRRASLAACARSPSPPTPAASVADAHVASTTVRVPGGCETRRTGPADAVGCYVAGTEQLGVVSATPLFWHLDSYPTLAAASAARQGRGTVAEAHGRVWLFTIAEAEWRPQGGQRVARVGPLPLVAGRAYAAHYIEGVVPPGATLPRTGTRVRRRGTSSKAPIASRRPMACAPPVRARA